jgi:mRNA-degrading endonuclease RelE of RelBE toxin-antitoxin system
MRTKVRVGRQVEGFVKSLAPEPRRALSQAIKQLAKQEGDTKLLEGKLGGWHRLRVGGYRVVYKATAESGTRVINCVYANHRSVVYEMFAELLADQLIPR